LREKDQKVVIGPGTARRGVLTDERDLFEANLEPVVAGFVNQHAALDMQFAAVDLPFSVPSVSLWSDFGFGCGEPRCDRTPV
jgi:hypothetical protein